MKITSFFYFGAGGAIVPKVTQYNIAMFAISPVCYIF